MTQPLLFGPPPLVDPALHPVSVPYAKGSETSKAGAQRVQSIAGQQCQTLLEWYRTEGPLTDAEAATLMDVERSTINARRNALIDFGKVEEKGQRKNLTSGVSNTTWGLRVA